MYPPGSALRRHQEWFHPPRPARGQQPAPAYSPAMPSVPKEYSGSEFGIVAGPCRQRHSLQEECGAEPAGSSAWPGKPARSRTVDCGLRALVLAHRFPSFFVVHYEMDVRPVEAVLPAFGEGTPALRGEGLSRIGRYARDRPPKRAYKPEIVAGLEPPRTLLHCLRSGQFSERRRMEESSSRRGEPDIVRRSF